MGMNLIIIVVEKEIKGFKILIGIRIFVNGGFIDDIIIIRIIYVYVCWVFDVFDEMISWVRM